MFVRITKCKKADGSVVEYAQLVHNEWDRDKGRARARVLWSFGRCDQIDVAALKRTIRSLSRLVDRCSDADEQSCDGVAVDFLGSRPAGAGWLLRRLWDQLGLRQVIERHVSDRRFRVDVEKAVFAMVANRALAPSSKRAIAEWVRSDVALDDVERVEPQHCYRAMDVLRDCADELQREVFTKVADLLNLEVDLLFVDTTSTYLETDDESELKKRGLSKDHRPDRPQVVIAMAVTRDGIPVRVWTLPGNSADVKTLRRIKEDLHGWRLGRLVWVFDRGFTSAANLDELRKAGYDYIAGEKMRDGQPAHQQALSRPGRYRKVRDNIEVKEVIVKDEHGRKRFIVVRNPAEQKRDKARRDELLEQLGAEIDKLHAMPPDRQAAHFAKLKADRTMGRYLTRDAKGRPCIDRAKVRQEERLDGKYLLSTSDDKLPAADVALGYRGLLAIEEAWRTLKTTLRLRPMYHRRDDRIASHIVLCWLALLLVRIVEVKTGNSWASTRRLLNRITLGRFQGEACCIERYAKPDKDQLAVYASLNVSPPPKLHHVTLTS